jgi:hypothetical protein
MRIGLATLKGINKVSLALFNVELPKSLSSGELHLASAANTIS